MSEAEGVVGGVGGRGWGAEGGKLGCMKKRKRKKKWRQRKKWGWKCDTDPASSCRAVETPGGSRTDTEMTRRAQSRLVKSAG